MTRPPPVPLEGWQEAEPLSRLVVIGQKLDEAEIRKLLMRF